MPSDLLFQFNYQKEKKISLKIRSEATPREEAESLKFSFSVENNIFSEKNNNSNAPVAIKILVGGKNVITGVKEEDNQLLKLTNDPENKVVQNYFLSPLQSVAFYQSILQTEQKEVSVDTIQFIVMSLKQDELDAVEIEEKIEAGEIDMGESWVFPQTDEQPATNNLKAGQPEKEEAQDIQVEEDDEDDELYVVSQSREPGAVENLGFSSDSDNLDDEQPVTEIRNWPVDCFDTDPNRVKVFELTVTKLQELSQEPVNVSETWTDFVKRKTEEANAAQAAALHTEEKLSNTAGLSGNNSVQNDNNLNQSNPLKNGNSSKTGLFKQKEPQKNDSELKENNRPESGWRRWFSGCCYR
jgi:hypothetical protein